LRPTPEWIKSYIGIPLKVEGNVVAILYEVNEQEKGFFDDKEREFLEEVSQQAALAWQKTFSTAELQGFYLFIIKSMIRVLESQNPIFLNHGERVAAICDLLGSKLGLDEQEMKALQIGALLHDAGRFLSDPMEDENSDKSASAPEKDTVSTDDHPRRGAEIFPTAGIYGQIREGIMYHHERYDGSGYPEGLERTEIPLIARIIAVADLYDAMTRLCPEEDRVDHYTAMRDMKRAMGSLLDPLVVVVMEEIEAELQEVIK
ncbi:MAG: HD domain-containing phosphohydrolase, partial [Syntrophomonas sp.]